MLLFAGCGIGTPTTQSAPTTVSRPRVPTGGMERDRPAEPQTRGAGEARPDGERGHGDSNTAGDCSLGGGFRASLVGPVRWTARVISAGESDSKTIMPGAEPIHAIYGAWTCMFQAHMIPGVPLSITCRTDADHSVSMAHCCGEVARLLLRHNATATYVEATCEASGSASVQ